MVKWEATLAVDLVGSNLGTIIIRIQAETNESLTRMVGEAIASIDELRQKTARMAPGPETMQ